MELVVTKYVLNGPNSNKCNAKFDFVRSIQDCGVRMKSQYIINKHVIAFTGGKEKCEELIQPR